MKQMTLNEDRAKLIFSLMVEEQATTANELKTLIAEKVDTKGQGGERVASFIASVMSRSLRMTSSLLDYYSADVQTEELAVAAARNVLASKVAKVSAVSHMLVFLMKELGQDITLEKATELLVEKEAEPFGMQTNILAKIDTTLWDRMEGVFDLILMQTYFIGALGDVWEGVEKKTKKLEDLFTLLNATVISRNPRLVTHIFKSPKNVAIGHIESELVGHGISAELARTLWADLTKALSQSLT